MDSGLLAASNFLGANSMAYDYEFTIAKNTAIEAGKAILEIYGEDLEVILKFDDTPVTRADYMSNELILEKLIRAFPNHAFLSEETTDDLTRLKKEYCWIIDPLDGTKEFIRKNGEFTINIALAKDREIVLGIVYAPVQGELFYAIRGEGAFMEKLGIVTPLHVSNRINDLCVLKSRSNETVRYAELLARHMDRIMTIHRMGSSYKGCLIARGDYDLYYNFGHTMVWDTAPVDLIVTEAGGYFRQSDHTLFDYNTARIKNEKGFLILNRVENRLE
jgi:3'(2'), 5'-bisphosphate nucleotidase